MARYGFAGKQFFDNSGDPLIGGKLYFYESGTDTLKDTYSDVNLSILNPNPVVLTAAGRQPDIFFSGSARVILTDADGVQIEVRDPEGGDVLEGVFSSWNSVTIYNSGEIVTGSDGNYYVSITDNNQGNNPTSDPTNWTQVRFIRVWNSNETYSIGQITEGSDGLLYSSVTNNNLNNDPTLDTLDTNWRPATSADLPNVVEAAAAVFAYNNF